MAQKLLDSTGYAHNGGDLNNMFGELYKAVDASPAVEAAGTASATAGAATLNATKGIITSEALSTAKGSAYTLTLSNSSIKAGSVVLASVQLGSATTGTPLIETIATSAGEAVISVLNNDAANALNGTIKVSFVVF